MKKLMLIMAVVAFASVAQAATVIGDFESGLDSWTLTGGWQRITSPWSGQNGSYVLDAPGGGASGTATSPNFVIDEKTIQFVAGGYGNNDDSSPPTATPWNTGGSLGQAVFANQDQNWQIIRVSDSAVLSQGTAPFQAQLNPYFIDVSNYVGQTVKMVVTSNVSTGWRINVDYVRTVNVESTYPNFTTAVLLDKAGQSGWTKGAAFDFNIGFNPEFGNPNTHPRTGGEAIRSYDPTTGSSTSPTFQLTREFLEFDSAGWGDGPGDRQANNRIYLRLASDDSILYEYGAPGTVPIGSNNANGWRHQKTDVSAWAGDLVYLEVYDNSGGWVGMSGAFMTGDITHEEPTEAIPEPSALALVALGLLGVARRRK